MKLNFIFWEDGPFNPKGSVPPAEYLRKEFTAGGNLKSAKLYMTALGTYVPYINGEKVGNQYLTPGYTEYSVRLQYQEYDVTHMIQKGSNCIAATVGDGWYRGSCGPMGMRASYGFHLALAARLELEYEDSKETIDTDETWKCTSGGPVRQQDIKLIELYDSRLEIPGWNLPGYDDSDWNSCSLGEYSGELVPSEGETVTAHEEFTPCILHTPDGATVLDFGQNISGFVSFKVSGKAGDEVRLIHGEVLDENGNFTVSNLGDSKMLKLGQELVYVLKDGEQSYEPLFMICGFRYAKVVSWPGDIKEEDIRATAVYSDLHFTGKFVCSNEKVNKLVSNVIWSMKGNFVDIPTDCPHRERAGWTGDINVFIECADLLADTGKFITKWLKDVIADQTDEGAILSIVPKVYMMNRKSNEISPGAAGWADAITRIPMNQYVSYGDRDVLEMCYPAMKKFVDYNISRASKTGKLKYARAKDRKFILDSGFHYGEWLEPGSANLVDALKASVAPDTEVATAWFYYSTKTLADAAEIIGMSDDAEKYREFSQNIKKAYRSHFLNGIDSKRQCKYVRPLYMDIVDGEERAAIAKRLNDLVTANRYCVGTGFLTTYQILNVLTDNGYSETAYKMLENEECPGWLYEVDKGATTIWEGWDAIDPNTGKVKAKSLNHYSPGAAMSWLWTRCCGIRPAEPGYKAVTIKPYPGGKLTYAKASYESVSGLIESSWQISGGTFILDVTIPENVTATVVLPDGTVTENAKSGRYTCEYNKK